MQDWLQQENGKIILSRNFFSHPSLERFLSLVSYYQVGFRRLLILSLRSMALMRYRWRSFIILLKDSQWIYLYSVEPLLLLECLVFCRYAEACLYRSRYLSLVWL